LPVLSLYSPWIVFWGIWTVRVVVVVVVVVLEQGHKYSHIGNETQKRISSFITLFGVDTFCGPFSFFVLLPSFPFNQARCACVLLRTNDDDRINFGRPID
ncbi:hypothetical protein FRB91_004879, partial [Serendipita sp. 411]